MWYKVSALGSGGGELPTGHVSEWSTSTNIEPWSINTKQTWCKSIPGHIGNPCVFCGQVLSDSEKEDK